MHVGFVDVGGVPTRCFVGGQKGAPPLLLIHGLTLNSEIWLRNIDTLGQDHFVVAPDMLGHGFSGPLGPKEGGPLIAQKVDHLLKLADTLGLERFHVCGSSYGGLVAALLYFKEPNRVHRLVINGSSSSFNSQAQLESNLKSTLEQMQRRIREGDLQFWQQRVRKGYYDASKAPLEMALSLMTSYAQEWAVEAWETSVTELMDPRIASAYRILDRLPSLKIETLVLWGREDPGAHYENAVKAVAQMPKARLMAFERCGHFPMLEHPERFNRLISAFTRAGMHNLEVSA